jgi:putative transposase
LQAARAALFRLSSHLNQAHLLSPADINRLKLTLKRGRGSRVTPDALRMATQECLALAEEFTLRRPEPPVPLSDAHTVAAETARVPPLRKPRSPHHASIPAAGDGRHREVAAEAPAVPRLGGLAEDPRKLEVLTERHRLVRLMDEGLSARDALKRLGLTESRLSWAQKTYRRFRTTGSLTDGRWSRRTKRHILTPAVEQIILQIWNSYPGASAKNIHNLLVRCIEEQNRETDRTGATHPMPVPAYTTVWEYLKGLPPAIQAARGGRMDVWDKQGRPVTGRDSTLYANQVAQADHTPLRIWARIEVAPGEWMPVQPWLTTVLDVHSRAVMGYVVSARYPDSWTIALAIRHAVLAKDDPAWPMHGKPELVVFDRGKDFGALSVKSLLEALAISVEFCAPHNPNEKPEQERFFLTLKTRVRELRTAMENIGRSEGAALKKIHLLPTVPQLRQEIHRFIGEYHQAPHRSHGECPATLWTETARVRPAEPQEMDVLLLKDDKLRTVTKEGVRFTLPDGAGGLYRARELWDHWKEDVRLRYNPDDMLSVLVYAADTGAFICEAWLAGAEGSRYTDADLMADRKAVRAGIVQRTRGYVQLTIEQDRPRKRKKAKDELTRKIAEAEADRPALSPAEAARAAKKAELRALFKGSDRAPAGEVLDA